MMWAKRVFFAAERLGALSALCCLGALEFGCVTSSGTVLRSKESEPAESPEPSDSETSSESSTAPDTASASDTGAPTGSRSPLGIIPSAVEDWSSAYPFIDLMKQSRDWYDWDNSNNDFNVDDNGWVRSLGAGQTAGTVFLTNGQAPVVYDRVVVRYDGQGTIEYDWDAVKVDEESAPGRDVVRITSGDHLLKITDTDADDYLRNISIVPEPLEGNHAGGQVFNPVWLDRMQGFGAVRFSKWSRINESLLENWEERPVSSMRTWAPGGVPYSVMIALANRLKAAPWLTVPHLATDDFAQHLAALVRDTLDDGLAVYIEHSSAPWKPGTAQYRYAVEAGAVRWGEAENAPLQWHAMRSARLCDIFKTEVFADAPERVHCVLTAPIEAPDLAEALLMCPDWVEEESGRAPCYQHGIDSMAVSGFFHGCLQDAPYIDEIRTWLDDDGGIAKGMEQLADGRHLPGCEDDLVSLAGRYRRMAEVAERFGLGLLAFEGGQNITANGTAYQEDQQLIDFHVGLNRDPRMSDRYEENFDYWRAAGGHLFIHFVEAEPYGKHGSFGALEHITQETSPKWEALTAFREAPCWWDGC